MKKINQIFYEAKKSLILAIPLLFSEWLFALNFFVVTWISAQLGRESLAAIAIAQSIYFFLLMMISGISAATAILAAQNLGSKNIDSIKDIFAESVLLNLILAVVASLILWNAPYIFLPLLGIDDPNVAHLITITLRAFMWSILPLTFLIMIEKFLIGVHRTRLVLLFTTLTIPISMIANYSLVLGKFGLSKCGLAGFGYGHAIAYSVLVIMFIIMSKVMPTLNSYKLFSSFKNLLVSRKYFFEIWRIGWPLGAMFSIEVGAILVFTFLMSLFGTDVLAAYQLTRQYLVFALVTLFALTESAAVRVSYAVGKGYRNLVKLSAYVSMSIGFIFMFILFWFYLSAKNFLISLDLNMLDPVNRNIIFYTKHFLTAIAVLVIFDGIRNITAGALRGLKDSKSNMYSSIIGYWLAGLPLAYLFGKIYDFRGEGLWVGFILGIVLSAIYLLVRFQKLSDRIDLQNLIMK
jgi:multidrug resistance protein, MATE family